MTNLNLADRLITEFDIALRSISGATSANRPSPAQQAQSATLTHEERESSIQLMRVNHVGEVCAQALYQAQALSTRDAHLARHFRDAAADERDHLAWTAERLQALGGRPSWLNPVWYAGAFALGWVAGRMGDRISLGFVEETERQVEQHLAEHLERLPHADAQSRAVVEQMRHDEAEHANNARAQGATALPLVAREAMRAMANLMKVTAARI